MLKKLQTVACATAMIISVELPTTLKAQELPKELPTKEDLPKDNKLFINLARKALKWDDPTEPFKMVGPLHFVGTKGLSSFLFATSEGHQGCSVLLTPAGMTMHDLG